MRTASTLDEFNVVVDRARRLAETNWSEADPDAEQDLKEFYECLQDATAQFVRVYTRLVEAQDWRRRTDINMRRLKERYLRLEEKFVQLRREVEAS